MTRRAYALDALRAEIDARWSGRDLRSDGWIGDQAHRDRPSDHNPNGRGVVQAIDVDEHTDTTETSEEVGRWLVEALRTSRDPRIKYVIYEGRMFSSYPTSTTPAWTWRGGTGHEHHVHISVVDDPKLYDNRSPWFKEQTMANSWLDRWPPYWRDWAVRAKGKGLITEDTDPSKPMSEVSLAEFLIFLDRDKG
jgi:hypothetical protein